MKHWKVLQQHVLSSANCNNKNSLEQYSVKRINSFDLLSSTFIGNSTVQYLIPFPNTTLTITIHQNLKTNLQDCNDETEQVDNTGNVGIWLSEEVLGFLLSDSSSFLIQILKEQFKLFTEQNQIWKSLELGCGQSALASIILFHRCKLEFPQIQSEIFATDGNQFAISNAATNILQNCHETSCTLISSFPLVWQEKPEQLKHSIDFIFGADCLFFTNFHDALLDLLHYLLTREEHGLIILIAPKRGKSLSQFIEKVSKRSYFTYSLQEFYHETVTMKHNQFLKTRPEYDPLIHYPLCIVIRRKIV